MSDPVTQSDAEQVLSSVRRLVVETESVHNKAAFRRGMNKLVLTSQLRVTDNDVLVLRAQDAVDSTAQWREYEEPSLATHPKDEEAKETNEDAPLLLTNKISEPSKARRTDVAELTAKIAALETAIAKTVDQWEPDGAGLDAYAGTKSLTMDWPDDRELDATGKPAKTVSDVYATAGMGKVAEAADAPIVDEEMLRRIVSEIVRAELQGALGERITRNVRKLVRREIHRVLSAQPID